MHRIDTGFNRHAHAQLTIRKNKKTVKFILNRKKKYLLDFADTQLLETWLRGH